MLSAEAAQAYCFPVVLWHTHAVLVLCCVRLCCVLQNGQGPLSDLQCTTSSEALLAGKAPTFRLLVWAIDRQTGGDVGSKQSSSTSCSSTCCSCAVYSRLVVMHWELRSTHTYSAGRARVSA